MLGGGGDGSARIGATSAASARTGATSSDPPPCRAPIERTIWPRSLHGCGSPGVGGATRGGVGGGASVSSGAEPDCRCDEFFGILEVTM